MATYSAATCAPFAATEGFISRTRKESATPTTAKTNPVEKIEAIEAVTPPALRRGRFTVPDKLIASLRGP
jgi:hypothetical protein